MAHIVIEYSANLRGQFDLDGFLRAVHGAALATGVFPIESHLIGKTPVFWAKMPFLREPDSASGKKPMTHAGKKPIVPPRSQRKRELLPR